MCMVLAIVECKQTEQLLSYHPSGALRWHAARTLMQLLWSSCDGVAAPLAAPHETHCFTARPTSGCVVTAQPPHPPHLHRTPAAAAGPPACHACIPGHQRSVVGTRSVYACRKQVDMRRLMRNAVCRQTIPTPLLKPHTCSRTPDVTPAAAATSCTDKSTLQVIDTGSVGMDQRSWHMRTKSAGCQCQSTGSSACCET
jgi:hypothetical protein